MTRATDNLPAKQQLELIPGYFQAVEMLKKATRFDEVQKIRTTAAGFIAAATAARDTETIALASELKLRAERRAGAMLIEAKQTGDRRGPGRPEKESFPDGTILLPTLKQLGIVAKEAMAWQRVARIPDAEFEKRVRQLRESGRISTNQFIRNGAFSSESDVHLTPREILQAVIDVMGWIDLDPCAEAHGAKANVPAKEHYTKKDDGLSKLWKGRVFMNPPYGLLVPAWVEYLIAAHSSGAVPEAIALVAARVDTTWFKRFDEFPVCFVTGRLKFSGADNGAMFPSAIFYLGTIHRAAFISRFADLGSVRPPAFPQPKE